MRYLLVLSLSFVIGFSLAIIVSRFGIKLGFIDMPKNRSSHTEPTPRGGGIGIPAATVLTTFLFVNDYFVLVVLSFILALFSLIEDKRGIPVTIRFLVELIFSTIIVISYKMNSINLLSSKSVFWLVLFFTALIIYITASTNFFNFMDGINGIAGLEAMLSFGFLGLYSFLFINSNKISIISLSILASSLGFLLLNFPKARVFMGDVGSIFIGFLFSSLVVILANNLKDFLILNLFQSFFYIDCISTILLRLCRGENIFKAHLMHLYQQLVHKLGWSHFKVTCLFSISQLIVASLSLLLYQFSLFYTIILWMSLFVLYIVVRVRLKLV